MTEERKNWIRRNIGVLILIILPLIIGCLFAYFF